MAVNIHITIIELNALHTKRQNLFQELDAVIHLLMEDRKSGSAGMPRPISYAVFCLKKKKNEDRSRDSRSSPPATHVKRACDRERQRVTSAPAAHGTSRPRSACTPQ